MADGILCRHCGWDETSHKYPENETGIRRRIKGYNRTLYDCRGFVGEIEPIMISDFELEYLEHRAQARAAWGQLSAIIRQKNFDDELKRHDKSVRESYGPAKEIAVKRKKEFIEEAKSQNHGFWVG